VTNANEAKYRITVRLEYALGGSGDRLEMVFKAEAGDVVLHERVSTHKSEASTREFIIKIEGASASLGSKIYDHENRYVNIFRALTPFGVFQFKHEEYAFGSLFLITELGAIAISGINGVKAWDSYNEADASRKKAHSPLGDNKEDFDKYMSDARKFDTDFKNERQIAFIAGGSFLLLWLINGIYTSTYTNKNIKKSNAFLTPIISPTGEAMAGLYWTMNF
jgi:hypothetical protein